MKKTIIFIGLLFMVVGGYAQIITPIANIQDSISVYNGEVVTIEGVITIGAGVTNGSMLNAFIQDDSDKGIEVFDYDITTSYQQDIIRGNKLRINGEIDEYQGVTEIKDFTYEVLETNLAHPFTSLTIPEIQNYNVWEGTFVSTSGTLIEDPYFAGGGYNITIEDDSGDQLVIRVWDSTGIEVNNLEVGQLLDINGIISIYNNQSQLVPGYPEDLSINVNIDEEFIFKADKVLYLNNYPNPFNPATTISFSLPERSIVEITVFNLKGQKIKTITNNQYPIGDHSFVWNGVDEFGNSVGSGVYMYKLSVNGKLESIRKCLLLK